MPGENVTTRDSYPRRRPPTHPILNHVPVGQLLPAEAGELFPYSDYDSERFGGPGAKVQVVMFPGDPMQYAWDFQKGHPRPAARDRAAVRGLVVPAPVPQTVSNLRRDQLAQQEEALEPGKLDIFEGVA
jgi:hypothetical protein